MRDDAITLHVRNMGHIPAKKNYHFPNKNGGLCIDKRVKDWTTRCTASFVFALLSGCQTEETGTLMVPLLRSLIASLPQDDNWKIISEIQIKAVGTIAGDEGATITIERIA